MVRFGNGMSDHPLYGKYIDMVDKFRNDPEVSVCENWLGESGIYNFIDDVYPSYREMQTANQGHSIRLRYTDSKIIDKNSVYFERKGTPLTKVRYVDKNTGDVKILSTYKEVSNIFKKYDRGSCKTYATKKIAKGETYRSKEFYLEPISG